MTGGGSTAAVRGDVVKILPIFVPHSGCKHACVYCDQHTITGVEADSCVSGGVLGEGASDTSETQNARQNATMTLRDAFAKTNVRQSYELAFYGGTFTAILAERRRAFLQAAQPYIREGRVSSIRISTHPLYIDDAILDELWSFGVRTIELGAQSMDDAVLKACGRGHTAADVASAARLITKRGFRLGLQQMTALPLATRQSDIESAKRLRDLEPWGVRIYPTVVLRGTPLETLWRRGEYKAETLCEAVERAACLLEIYEGIKILRIGLHASEQLCKNALAGGYHPRLGEMVRQAAMDRR